MQYSDLESWQLEEMAERVHPMVNYLFRLHERMNKKGFPHDRLRQQPPGLSRRH